MDGIENPDKINSISKDINLGKDISDKYNFPNIKIVKSVESKFVLFDGHHTILAYMMSGRKFLYEIPHLIVENLNGFVLDEEIKVFYGEHAGKIKKSDWFTFVINWGLPKDDQLQRRVQNNMDELYNELIKKMKG